MARQNNHNSAVVFSKPHKLKPSISIKHKPFQRYCHQHRETLSDRHNARKQRFSWKWYKLFNNHCLISDPCYISIWDTDKAWYWTTNSERIKNTLNIEQGHFSIKFALLFQGPHRQKNHGTNSFFRVLTISHSLRKTSLRNGWDLINWALLILYVEQRKIH